MNRLFLLCFGAGGRLLLGLLLLALSACSSGPRPSTPTAGASENQAALRHPVSRWTLASWSELPGFETDPLHEAWNAWLKSCERPGPNFAALCSDIRLLSLGTGQEQRDWMRAHLQPYRVEALQGEPQGLLTGYYEPQIDASRQQREGFSFPLYRYPAQAGAVLKSGKPWYSRQQIDTLPEARAALRGHELVWLAHPLDVLVLQIQGSARVHVLESDGSQRWSRLSYAGSNNRPIRAASSTI